jgi:K(+)-stimulated pyrophosphate-energized sodium pump
MMDLFLIELLAIFAGLIALAMAGVYFMLVMSLPTGTKKMREISNAVREGAMAYLKRQYMWVAIIAVIIAVMMTFALGTENLKGAKIALGFACGAILSALAGFIGMSISTRANVRCAQAAKKGLQSALTVAVRGGAVTGLCVVGLALLGVTGFYLLYKDVDLVIGFAFGASLISLFARLGGGIYTKAADVGADLVGKIEAGIPEDDPRNPAVIADNVGDNVGDCAGMGADLFETYVVTAIGAMLLGTFFFKGVADAEKFVVFPLALGAMAIFASIIGTFFVKAKNTKSIMNALYTGVGVSAVISLVLFAVVIQMMDMSWWLFIPACIGIAITALMIVITEYYTATKYSPVQDIAESSKTGTGTNIIAGLAIGLQSTFFPVIVICVGILSTYWIGSHTIDGAVAVGATTAVGGGLYSIAIAAMAMLSTAGMIVTLDSYGPITDNAGGIAEMAGLPEDVRETTDALDAVGNTTKAVTKGYAIGSAALGALALFVAYTQEVQDYLAAHAPDMLVDGKLMLRIDNPVILVGIFIGALLPFIFSALTMKAVGRAAFSIVEEVRRQFKEIPGIMEYKAKPDYAKCVDIVTAAAQKEMVLPAFIAVIAPLVVGFGLGFEALAGLLIGVIVSGLLLAILMTTGGASWDNAKKYIEQGHYGGKGSPAHAAAVVGDTVGDPFKDTSGPALNPLIKVINTIAILFAVLITSMWI